MHPIVVIDLQNKSLEAISEDIAALANKEKPFAIHFKGRIGFDLNSLQAMFASLSTQVREIDLACVLTRPDFFGNGLKTANYIFSSLPKQLECLTLPSSRFLGVQAINLIPFLPPSVLYIKTRDKDTEAMTSELEINTFLIKSNKERRNFIDKFPDAFYQLMAARLLYQFNQVIGEDLTRIRTIQFSLFTEISYKKQQKVLTILQRDPSPAAFLMCGLIYDQQLGVFEKNYHNAHHITLDDRKASTQHAVSCFHSIIQRAKTNDSYTPYAAFCLTQLKRIAKDTTFAEVLLKVNRLLELENCPLTPPDKANETARTNQLITKLESVIEAYQRHNKRTSFFSHHYHGIGGRIRAYLLLLELKEKNTTTDIYTCLLQHLNDDDFGNTYKHSLRTMLLQYLAGTYLNENTTVNSENYQLTLKSLMETLPHNQDEITSKKRSFFDFLSCFQFMRMPE